MTLNLLKFGACALFGLNIASNFSTGKELGGKSNVEVSKQFDTLLTPDGWAFSIWSVIFIGEALGLVYLCNVQSTLTGVLVPFMYATLFQSLWSIAFSRELLLASALILTFISYSLYQCCNELQVAQLTVFGQLLIAYPIRIHWAWSTAAALVNWNMFLVSLNYPFDQGTLSLSKPPTHHLNVHSQYPYQQTQYNQHTFSTGYEVIAAFASVWLAAGVASYRALFMSDGVFPAVMAWTFAWMSSKIRHNPPLGSICACTFLRISVSL